MVNIYNRDATDYKNYSDIPKVDMTYTDPPWNKGLLTHFNKIANIDVKIDFKMFLEKLIENISKHTTKHICIEMGKQNIDLLMSICDTNNILKQEVYEIRYNHRNNAFLYYGVKKDVKPFDLKEVIRMDDTSTPFIAIKIIKPNIVLDPCMGNGLTAKACIKNNVRFYGFDINNNRVNKVKTIIINQEEKI